MSLKNKSTPCKPNGITNSLYNEQKKTDWYHWYWYLDLVAREALYLEHGNSNTQ